MTTDNTTPSPVPAWQASIADLILHLHQWQAAPAGEQSSVAWDRLQSTINALSKGAAKSAAPAPAGDEAAIIETITKELDALGRLWMDYGKLPGGFSPESGSLYGSIQFTRTKLLDYVRMLATASAAQPVEASSVTIDFKQATELLDMFGGQPAEISLEVVRDRKDGLTPGLYAWHTDYPEEGSVNLGVTDADATPPAKPDSDVKASPSAVAGNPVSGVIATKGAEERFCNKCGYFGPDELHQRPNGTGQCGYLSSPCAAPSQAAEKGEPTFDQWWNGYFQRVGKEKAWPVKEAAREIWEALATPAQDDQGRDGK